MCEGFGVIVTKDGRYLFCEPEFDNNCSHSEILKRAGIEENKDKFVRGFVRVEYPDWKAESFTFDESSSLPAWVDEAEVRTRCDKLLGRVSQALAEYENVSGQAWAKYENVRYQAWVEYDKARYQARAEYDKVFQAWTECMEARDRAWTEYQKVRDHARAEFINRISTIDGYVAKKEA